MINNELCKLSTFNKDEAIILLVTLMVKLELKSGTPPLKIMNRQ
jgi:hypothetical protein